MWISPDPLLVCSIVHPLALVVGLPFPISIPDITVRAGLRGSLVAGRGGGSGGASGLVLGGFRLSFLVSAQSVCMYVGRLNG